MSAIEINQETLLKNLTNLFGSYRAEWSRKDIFRHFSEPAYFSDLVNFRPCVLQGGRGSGKTTALRGLSYVGQYELKDENIARFDAEVPYVGVYYKIDTNHVRAFTGVVVNEELWQKLFGHYFNLVIVSGIADFLEWHRSKNSDDEELTEPTIRQVINRLCFNNNALSTNGSLADFIYEALSDFQNVVNNIGGYNDSHLSLSVIGEPIDFLLKKVRGLKQFANKYFYLLIDEYENLLDYQQVVINTLIKHAAENYTFKIGVKEAGWRKKHTLNQDESLYDPADYALIDIAKKFSDGDKFYRFAKSVCEKRFNLLLSPNESFDVGKALENLSIEEIALRLGVEKHEWVRQFDLLDPSVAKVVEELTPLRKFAIAFWAITHDVPLIEEIQNFAKNRKAWDTRYENYKYHLLFKIKTGRGSGSRQMLYCGFETFVKLASNNIRFLMELVYKTFEKHLSEGNGLNAVVSAEIQTDMAIKIGEKNLAQLECVEAIGPRIVDMLCGLGRIFEKLAKEKSAGTPEVCQFCIDGEHDNVEVEELLTASVKHLALIRTTGNKLEGFKTKAYDYSLHPIFSPFFTFSYRRKRKMQISPGNLLGLAHEPEKFVAKILNEYCGTKNECSGIALQLGLPL